MCKKLRTQRSTPIRLGQDQLYCPEWLPSPQAWKTHSFPWALMVCATHDYMLSTTCNDLKLLCLFLQANFWASWKQRDHAFSCCLSFGKWGCPEHFPKSSPWLCSKCQWSHPCTQNPSGLSEGIRAFRCNLRITSRINKSLPWWQILPFTSSPIKANFSNPIPQVLSNGFFVLFMRLSWSQKQTRENAPGTT